jgi:hypothetical protein
MLMVVIGLLDGIDRITGFAGLTGLIPERESSPYHVHPEHPVIPSI